MIRFDFFIVRLSGIFIRLVNFRPIDDNEVVLITITRH